MTGIEKDNALKRSAEYETTMPLDTTNMVKIKNS